MIESYATRLVCRVLLAMVVAVVVLAGAARPILAQGERARPRQSFFAAIDELYSGEYRRALRGFQSELRSGVKSTEGRWIDSICYHTMLGETYYHMGQNAAALKQYDAAVELFLAHSEWLMRVEFPRAVQADRNLGRQPSPWGRSSRNVVFGRFDDTMLMRIGRINNAPQLQRGGVVRQAMLIPVRVAEIVRCTTLAIRRRGELLGPLAKHDGWTGRLVAALARRPGPPNHWSASWISLQLGMAQASAGKTQQAIKNLQNALLVNGQFDHPLSCVAMVELGRLALAAGEMDRAAQLFEEAIYSAYYFENIGVLQEALWVGAETHLIANRPGLYPPLATGARWAHREDYHHLEASMLLLAAENQAALGQIAAAQTALGQGRKVMARRDMGLAVLGARANYLAALVGRQTGTEEQAATALQAALAFQENSSRWLFQVTLADSRFLEGALTARNANKVYAELLRDPTPADWVRWPFESLSILAIPHPQSFELWFTAALKRKEIERALEISDAARRHRFYTSLSHGGRLLALRRILETPAEQLPSDAALQRQDLLVRFPAYDEMARRARAVRQKILAAGLLPEDDQARKEQQRQLAELSSLSEAREAMLRGIALRRVAADMVFPPQTSIAQVQEKLGEATALLAFFVAGDRLHAFLIGKKPGQYAHWQIHSPKTFRREIVELLRALGNMDPNRELSLETLVDPSWREASRKVWKRLFTGSKVDVRRDIEELVIVPDGLLWYLPFEALVSDDGEKGQLPNSRPEESPPLLSHVRIRYAPTIGLSVPGLRTVPPIQNTGIVVGKLFPRDADEVSAARLEQLLGVVPSPVVLRAPLPGPAAVIGSLLDELIVLDDVAPSSAYGWLPIPEGRGRSNIGLEAWMALPWGGPQRIVLPGFHTAAESALRRRGGVVDGHETFLSVCGLMAGGARTIVLSRWRTGGESSFALVRKFTEEVTQSSPAAAWQRSTELLQSRSVDWEREPRVQRFDVEVPPLATHPFFWSACMLIDSGVPSAPEDLEEPEIPEEPKISEEDNSLEAVGQSLPR